MDELICNAAGKIEERVGELLAMVDQIELDPRQADFYRMRALLSDVGDRSAFILDEAKKNMDGRLSYARFPELTGLVE